MTLKIAAVQLEISPDENSNIQKALSMIEKAANLGAKLVVLPELFPFGILRDREKALSFSALTMDILSSFEELCRKSGLVILAGLVHRGSSGLFYNSLFVTGCDKHKEQARYDKIHLFEPFGEKLIFEPGCAPSIFYVNLDGYALNIGPLICFDIRFPELCRYYCYRGVNLLAVSSLWPLSRRENYECLLKARAMENQCFLIAANAWGKSEDMVFAGSSSVIAPDGSVLSRAEDGECIALAEIDLKRIDSARAFFNTCRPPGAWALNSKNKVLTLLKMKEVCSARKMAGQRMVFTNGCFDILHAGHVSYLEKARSLGDFLVVGVNSDDSIRRIKGQDRPVNPEAQRVSVLSALESVDYVVLFEDDTPIHLIEELSPDVLVKGADWREEDIVGADIVKERGGRVERIAFEVQVSTTGIIDKISSMVC